MKKEIIELSIIMPCYNEGKKIYDNLLKTKEIIENKFNNFEIICIDDGSTDNTKQMIEKACKIDKKIKIISYKNNKGKGNALRVGTFRANGKYIAFLDSDLELSPDYIIKYVELLKKKKVDVVIGSKMHVDSKLNYPFIRKIYSLLYYLLLKILFNLKIKDTQTGLKVFKKEVVQNAMNKVLVKRFAFDIELLSIINSEKHKIIDAPIELNFTRNHAKGRIKIKDIFFMLKDTFAIFYRFKFLNYYSKIENKKNDFNKKIYFIIGTEAELMKMYKTIEEAKQRGYETYIVSTGQNDIDKSSFLAKINAKIDIKLYDTLPQSKNSKNYLKWFLKTKRNGIIKMKKEVNKSGRNNCLIVVHGDTLSTLLGSLISRKIHTQYVHVESGPRSYNWFSPFPEEIDRYFSSKKSVINFCPEKHHAEYASKTFKGKAVNTNFNTGIETLYDALNEIKNKKNYNIIDNKYFVFAIHRQENLMNKTFMENTIKRIIELSSKIKCVFIYHEQTKNYLCKYNLWNEITNNKNLIIIPRQNYVNFINIIKNSEFVIGDGCGNQQEFYYLGKPYLIMRTKVEESTEGLKWNAIPFNNDFKNIVKFYDEYKKYSKPMIKYEICPSKIIMDEIDCLF